MKEGLRKPLLVAPVASALIMGVCAVGALATSDPLVINPVFFLYLMALPLLVAGYLLITTRGENQSLLGWLGAWLGISALSAVAATMVVVCFYALLPEGPQPSYNYDHFGFSSYIRGRERQVQEGGQAVDGVVYDLKGNSLQLASLWRERPVVVEFGSITCPVFVGKVPTMDEMAGRYRGEVDFYVL